MAVEGEAGPDPCACFAIKGRLGLSGDRFIGGQNTILCLPHLFRPAGFSRLQGATRLDRHHLQPALRAERAPGAARTQEINIVSPIFVKA